MSTDNYPDTCSSVRARLEDHVEGELEQRESDALIEHCISCIPCRAELELALSIRSGLNALEPERCPDDVVRRTMDSIGEAQPFSGGSREPVGWLKLVKPIWKPVAAASAAAAVVFMVLSSPISQEESVTPAEVDRALRQAKYALAVVSEAGRRTGAKVAADVESAVLEPVRQALGDANKNGI
jgi:hypothetical protein